MTKSQAEEIILEARMLGINASINASPDGWLVRFAKSVHINKYALPRHSWFDASNAREALDILEKEHDQNPS